jgi:phosphoglycolate phosphatase-like HAD superfamily hydrolase
MKRVYVFDIDGTLSDTTHRQHLIPKDWPAFFAACDRDPPIPHMIEVASHIAGADDILFATGRSEDVREKTLAWLRAHLGMWIFSEDLYMRPSGDHRADTIVKSELMDQVIADGWTPVMVFEDRTSVVNMWRERGIPCCQVAPGDF